MKMIVGIGNPGKEYENTRHNIGFMVLENYLNGEKLSKKHNSLILLKNINNEKVLFVKPLTYVNLSGSEVAYFKDYYDIDIKDILIIQDDIDMEVGNYKLKLNSSSGGHNGIKSIISALKTQEVFRLKIGMSHNRNIDTADYVLGKISKDDLNKIEKLHPIFNAIIDDFSCGQSIEYIMNKYN